MANSIHQPTTKDRTRVKRVPERGIYDTARLYPILDEALICHVGFAFEGFVTVIPTACWREGHRLFIHGSTASRLIRTLAAGAEACITITHVDGLVMARSAFHHSMNYRSAVIYAKAQPIEGDEEKDRILRIFMEKLAPGRWEEARKPNRQELKATAVLAFDLTESSVKIREGGPKDDEEDYALPVWAGVIPLTQQVGIAETDPLMRHPTALPNYGGPYFPNKEA